MDPETLRQSLLALLTPDAHPLTAIRIDQILALHRIVALIEDALPEHPPLVQDPKRGPRIHPLLDALAKNRERLRRAVNDLERSLPKTQRPRKEDKVRPPLAEPINAEAETARPLPHSASPVKADRRVRPANGKNAAAPPSNPTRADFLRQAQAQLYAPLNPRE